MDKERVKLAAKFYDANDALRLLWADQYENKIQYYRDAIRKAAKLKKLNAFGATILLVEKATEGNSIPEDAKGMFCMCLLSAAVDLIENVESQKKVQRNGKN